MSTMICTSLAVALTAAPTQQETVEQTTQEVTEAVQADEAIEAAETVEAASVIAPAPLAIQKRATGNAKLPANTEVLLKMNQEVTTKGKTWSEGDTFALSVVHDVMVGDYVVIPNGARATGRITWLTNKGMFGKSGKMDIELEYVTVNGRRIDLEGTYRQEGEGNTVATVAGVIAVPIAGLFITGRSGRIPQGREMMATTESDIELAIPASEFTDSKSPLAPVGSATKAWDDADKPSEDEDAVEGTVDAVTDSAEETAEAGEAEA
ncbi:MAG: hypothetical protein ABJK59_14210 [Erythrobacter sp.]|uniref:hypothetical protein n=1 Tax=Erythrobacter sp. TaxID=1042 RepID=UPI003299B34C